MGVIGGSRHYGGGGLGAVLEWDCPSCGEKNAGAIEQGCVHCGAGKPGRKADAPAPPPPPAPAAEPVKQASDNLAELWITQHPGATLQDAFTAGYIEGIRAARHAQLKAQPPAVEPTFTPEAKTYRTLVAALSLFRDQVLAGSPEEIASGEWCSVEEADQLIAQLTESIEGRHV